MILVVVLGGTFGLEQPRNSHLEFYPMFVEFLSMLYKMDHKSAVSYHFTEKCNVYYSLLCGWQRYLFIGSPTVNLVFWVLSIWLRYGESGGGWPTIPVVPRRDTLHTQTRPTSGNWTRVFCNGRGGLVTRDPRLLWLTSQSPLEKSATKGHPPSRRRRPWDYFFWCEHVLF